MIRWLRKTSSRLHWFRNYTADMPGEKSVTVSLDTGSPTKAWEKIAVKQRVEKVDPSDVTPISENKLRFVCISDTHTKIELNADKVPAGDVLVHAGDFTNIGLPLEVKTFNNFLGSQPHPVKIVIAGNHDLTFDTNLVENRRDHLLGFGITTTKFEDKLKEYGVGDVKELLTNCVYLEDADVDVCGIKVYGSPWQPEFCDWGFNLARGQPCLDKWNLIPNNTDILVTHGPPIGHGDTCFDKQRAGCVELLSTIQQRVKPTYHIFGHIHEGYGMTTDGHTTYINASTCTLRYKPDNKPIIFDLPLPDGHTKEELQLIKPHRRIRDHSTKNILES